MPTSQSTKFAQVSLDLYGHQGSFDIGFNSQEDMDAAAQAFQEIGCKVCQTDPYRFTLTVTPPVQAS